MEKLSTVPYEETKHLVKKFFAKIIDLKEAEHKKLGEISELQVSRFGQQSSLALEIPTINLVILL